MKDIDKSTYEGITKASDYTYRLTTYRCLDDYYNPELGLGEYRILRLLENEMDTEGT